MLSLKDEGEIASYEDTIIEVEEERLRERERGMTVKGERELAQIGRAHV